MPIILNYYELATLKSSRLILTLKDSNSVMSTALQCRSLLSAFQCTSYYCTCYMNDQEKTNPGEENRVHVGVLWSENTTETMLVEFRTTLLHQLADAVIKESVWEQFPNAETSFLVHCAAREYGEFLLSASESLGHFLGKDGMNFLDGVHLVYNQLLLRDGDLMPKGVHNGFLNQLHTSAHSQGQILQPRAYGLVEATPSEIKQTNACKTLKGFHTFVRNIDSA